MERSSPVGVGAPRPGSALRRWLALPPPERRLVVRCCGLFARAAIVARLLPMPRVVAAIDRRASGRQSAPGVSASRALALLEATAARLRPMPRCLSQAIAGYELLRERGVDVRCVIGGRRGGPGLEAHAWLEAEGRVLLGGPVDGYQRIWQWPPD
jgi:hypothetical protein